MSWIAIGAASAGAILGGTGALGNKGGWGDAFKGAIIGGTLGKAGAGFGGGAAGAGGPGGLFGSAAKLGGASGGLPGGAGGLGSLSSLAGPLFGGGGAAAPRQTAPQQVAAGPSFTYDPAGGQQLASSNPNDALSQALLASRLRQQQSGFSGVNWA